MKTKTPNHERAKFYAQVKHAGQTYNDEVPYTYHLEMVVNVLNRFGVDTGDGFFVMKSAGYLHDVLEDTQTSYNDILERFGEEVAELVYAVTSERGRNRKERNAKTYPKIKGFPNAVKLKLADRIANVEYGSATGGKVDMYRKEMPEFEAGIRSPDEEDQITKNMWDYLKKILA